MADIKAADKPTIMVFNKIDQYKPERLDEDDLIHRAHQQTLHHGRVGAYLDAKNGRKRPVYIGLKQRKSGPV